MPTVLTEAQLADALRERPGWSGDTGSLHRTAELADFPTAIEVVDEVAVIAEQLDHHPDIDIRWRSLTFTCATHSAGGVTENDLKLIKEIDRILHSKPGPA